MYQRLNLKKPGQTSQPIWERIDLRRPVKPKCFNCRLKIQLNWRICPQCGSELQDRQHADRHRQCVWINADYLNLDSPDRSPLIEILEDAFAKVFSSFRGIDVFLTSEPPNPQEWADRFTHVALVCETEPVDYLGIASFCQGKVTDRALVRIDRILSIAQHHHLSSSHLSNLLANTISHEIAHTLGLDHSELAADVMNDGLDHRIHSLMPPSFHAEQIAQMNYAIYRDRVSMSKK